MCGIIIKLLKLKEIILCVYTFHPDLKMGYTQFQLIRDVLPILLLEYSPPTSTLLVSRVCVHVYVFLFYSGRVEEGEYIR